MHSFVVNHPLFGKHAQNKEFAEKTLGLQQAVGAGLLAPSLGHFSIQKDTAGSQVQAARDSQVSGDVRCWPEGGLRPLCPDARELVWAGKPSQSRNMAGRGGGGEGTRVEPVPDRWTWVRRTGRALLSGDPGVDGRGRVWRCGAVGPRYCSRGQAAGVLQLGKPTGGALTASGVRGSIVVSARFVLS